MCPSRTVTFLGAALSVLIVLVVVPAARADEIAYECGYDICTIDPDHPETHADLTKTESITEFEPTWSPDGTRIAFNGNYTGHAAIWTISAADPEAGVTEVVDNPEDLGGEPAWSPDGTQIAFAGTKPPTFTDENVYVSPASGASPPQTIGGTPEAEGEPVWSPSGDAIAFARGGDTWISAPEESATAHLLTNGLGIAPAWSPDGSRIATITTGEPHKVRVIAADGSGTATELPIGARLGSTVAWSPDSSDVVYIDEADHVRVAPTDPPGPGVAIQLPAGVIVPLFPSFSPDGSRVAFGARENSGGTETDRIYVAPAAGGEATAVTAGAVNAREPSWKPGPGGGGPGGGSPGGGSPGGGSPGGGSPGSGSGGGGSSGSGGGAKPPATRAPVVLKLAAFRHPYFNTGFLMAAYVPCSLGSSNAACHASGEATFDAPITHVLDYARSKAKPLVVAKGSVTVPNGQTKPLPLKLTAAGKKLVKSGKPLKITETIVETAPGAKPETTAKTFTLTPSKKS
jgi:Tol biopolymer transport system component